MKENCNFENQITCEFYKEKIIDRYNKTDTNQTTQLYKELFIKKEIKTKK